MWLVRCCAEAQPVLGRNHPSAPWVQWNGQRERAWTDGLQICHWTFSGNANPLHSINNHGETLYDTFIMRLGLHLHYDAYHCHSVSPLSLCACHWFDSVWVRAACSTSSQIWDGVYLTLNDWFWNPRNQTRCEKKKKYSGNRQRYKMLK